MMVGRIVLLSPDRSFTNICWFSSMSANECIEALDEEREKCMVVFCGGIWRFAKGE